MEGDADLWCSACGLRAAELLRGSKVLFECGESLTVTSMSGRWERVGEWHGRVVGEGNAFHNAGGRFCTHDLEEKQSLRELESGSESRNRAKVSISKVIALISNAQQFGLDCGTVQTETDTWLAGTPCFPGRRKLRLAIEAPVQLGELSPSWANSRRLVTATTKWRPDVCARDTRSATTRGGVVPPDNLSAFSSRGPACTNAILRCTLHATLSDVYWKSAESSALARRQKCGWSLPPPRRWAS